MRSPASRAYITSCLRSATAYRRRRSCSISTPIRIGLWTQVKEAVTHVRSDLPQSISEPLIRRVDAVGLGILTYAAISPGKTPEQLSYFVDDVVIRKLKDVAGVSSVERIGGVEREVQVALNPDRLQAFGSDRRRGEPALTGNAGGSRRQCSGRGEAMRIPAGARTVAELAGDHDQLCRTAARFASAISAQSRIRSPSRAPSRD